MNDGRAVDWAYTHALRAALSAHVGQEHTPRLPLLATVVDDVRVAAARDGLDALALVGLALLGNDLDEARRESARARAVASLVFEERRRRLSALLDDVGVPHAYFKGALMDALFWRGTGVRGATDIDVLVDASDLAAVTAILERAGAERLFIAERQASLHASHARVFHWASGGVVVDVDVHVSMLDAPPFRDPAHALLARRVVYETSQGPLVGLALDDALAWTGGKLVNGGFLDRTKLAVDAYALIALGADVDVARARARDFGASLGLDALLALVETRLGAPRPGLDLSGPFRALPSTMQRALAVAIGLDDAPRPLRGMPSRALFSDDHARGALSVLRWSALQVANRAWATPGLRLLARASSEYLSLKRPSSSEGESP